MRTRPLSASPPTPTKAALGPRAEPNPAPVTGPLDPDRAFAALIATHVDDADFVTALARGLAVMLALSARKRALTIAQVSHHTGLPRAAARRSLHTLAKLGFVAADDQRRFSLRPRVLSLSHAYLSSSPLVLLAQPILDRLGERLKVACSLAVLDGDEIVYLVRAASSPIMSPTLNVGRRLPAYCTSIGHVLLAHLPKAESDDAIRRTRFFRYNEHTIASAAALEKRLVTVRENGYAFTSQQMEMRICSLAVPVRDQLGRTIAGLNVILQGSPIAAQDMVKRYFAPLQEAAEDLGALLVI